MVTGRKALSPADKDTAGRGKGFLHHRKNIAVKIPEEEV